MLKLCLTLLLTASDLSLNSLRSSANLYPTSTTLHFSLHPSHQLFGNCTAIRYTPQESEWWLGYPLHGIHVQQVLQMQGYSVTQFGPHVVNLLQLIVGGQYNSKIQKLFEGYLFLNLPVLVFPPNILPSHLMDVCWPVLASSEGTYFVSIFPILIPMPTPT